MKITSKQINDMAQELEMGMKVYINTETLEYIAIPKDDILMMDSEPWEEALEEINYKWPGFILIEEMDSREAYKIMEAFVSEIDDPEFQQKLIRILDNRRPFANFKNEIDWSDYREAWFAFRTKKHEEYIKSLLDLEDIDCE